MSTSTYFYDIAGVEIKLQSSSSFDANGIPHSQLIIKDEEGNRVVCHIRGSQFYSFINQLRTVINEAMIEREVNERLKKQQAINAQIALNTGVGCFIVPLKPDPELNKEPNVEAAAEAAVPPPADSRMSLTIEDMELQQKDKEADHDAN